MPKKEQLELFEKDIKFVLRVLGWTHVECHKCYTVEEVWTKIGKLPFGSCYEVVSPTGEDTRQFIPL